MQDGPFKTLPAYSLPEKLLLIRSWRACGVSDPDIAQRLKDLWRVDQNRIACDKRVYKRLVLVAGPAECEVLLNRLPLDRGQIGQDYPGKHVNLIDSNHIADDTSTHAPVRHLPTGERNSEDDRV